MVQGQEAFDDLIEEIIPKTKLDNDQLLHLREELKVQKMLIEGVKEIEFRGGGYNIGEFVNIEKSTNNIESLLRNSIGARSTTINKEVANQIEDVVKGAIDRNGIKNTLLKTRDMVEKFGNSKKIFMTSVARRFGFDVGIVAALAFQIDYTLPGVMTLAGQPQFGVLFALPITTATTGTYAAIKSAVKFRQIVKMLGGVKNTIKHFSIVKSVQHFLGKHILLKYDVFKFEHLGKTFAMTVERQNSLSKLLGKFGFNKQLNYQSLMNLLDEKSFLPEIVEQTRRSKRPETVKFLRLINKVQASGNSEIMIEIHKKFGKFINEFKYIPELPRTK